MGLYELNQKLKIACQSALTFIQINKLTLKVYSHLRYINIHFYLKLQKPIMHRQLFRITIQAPECVKTHCNDLNKPFHFACQRSMIN